MKRLLGGMKIGPMKGNEDRRLPTATGTKRRDGGLNKVKERRDWAMCAVRLSLNTFMLISLASCHHWGLLR